MAEELRIKRQEAAEKLRIEEDKIRHEAVRANRAQLAQTAQSAQTTHAAQFARRSYASTTDTTAATAATAATVATAAVPSGYVVRTSQPPRTTTVSQAMAMPPVRVSIQNDFRRESTGQVNRRNANSNATAPAQPSRKERLERMMKKD